MDPELVEKVELHVNNCLGGGDEERQGKVEWLQSTSVPDYQETVIERYPGAK